LFDFVDNILKRIIAHKKEDLNMQFIKNFFNYEKTVIGLSGLRKRREYLKITLPDSYKKTYVANFEQNYLLL
jgi:hypothetical protein